jgi:hypothetical protein
MGTCLYCIHFDNKDFDNKRFGYCKQLQYEIYVEDQDENVLSEEKFVVSVDFGCIRHKTS